MNSNFILIFICLILGLFLRKIGKFPENSAKVLNTFVIYVSLPSLILFQVPKLIVRTEHFSQMLIPISMAWILFVLSIIFFKTLKSFFNLSPTVLGALILTAGLGNTSFVGIPILDSLYGKEGVGIGIIVDQPGTFLVLSTLGILVATILSPHEKTLNLKSIIKNVSLFPPFISLLLAILCFYTGIFEKDLFNQITERFSQTLVPLALVAVGFQLNISSKVLRAHRFHLFLGLTFKLFLSPLFFIFLYQVLLKSLDFSTKITILESAMAPMITASVVAKEFGFDEDVSNLMVGLGIPLSLITVYGWSLII